MGRRGRAAAVGSVAVAIALIAGGAIAAGGPPAGHPGNGTGNGNGKGNAPWAGGGSGAPEAPGTPERPGRPESPGAPTAPDGESGGAGDAPAPVLASSVVAGPESGTVLVRLPGTSEFVELAADAPVPVGSVLDATAGTVVLTSAVTADGTVQTGTFWGGVFEVRQSRGAAGMTDLILRGGGLAACGRPASARAGKTSMALEHGSRRARRAPSRRLWGEDSNGKFRTHGRNSVATVRGTRWLTLDTCAGTLTRVTEGAVVVRDRHRAAKVLVSAGERYLARAPRRAARAG